MTTGTNSETTHIFNGQPFRQCRRGCFHREPKDGTYPSDDWYAYLQHECDHAGETIAYIGKDSEGREFGYCSCAATIYIDRVTSSPALRTKERDR